QARFARAGPAQQHHDLAATHVERSVLEEDARAVSHAQVSHADRPRCGAGRRGGVVGAGLVGSHHLQLVRTAKMPSITTISTMLVGAGRVAEGPTEPARAPVVSPRWQATAAMVRPKTAALTMPRTKSPAVTASMSWL